MSKIITCPVCGKKKPVRNDAKVCNSNCRVKLWRKNKMFSVNMRRLTKPMSNRGLTYTSNDDGSVTINGQKLNSETEVEIYLMDIPRQDMPTL